MNRYVHLETIYVALARPRYSLAPAELWYVLSFTVNLFTGNIILAFSRPEEVYNYFNNSNNVLNQYFVKLGWAWNTVIVSVFYILHWTRSTRATAGLLGATSAVALVAAVARYLAATVWWVLFTKWCFGLPLMDRIFLFTGGKCAAITEHRLVAHTGAPLAPHLLVRMPTGVYESTVLSSLMCRRLRGSWEGGHDPLGHVFLLVHSLLYLFFETHAHWHLPALLTLLHQASNRSNAWLLLRKYPELPVLLLLVLWWFMLLNTNMYFHLTAENFVGLVFGYTEVAALYVVQRWLRARKETQREKAQLMESQGMEK